MKKCEDCDLNNTEECDIMACDVLDELGQRLIDCKAELEGINKILNYCSNWTDRLEMEMGNDICSRGMDVIGEEFAIIDKMATFCNKRMGELDVELTNIRGQLSRYNHGDYDITCEFYKWLHDPSDTSEQPVVYTVLCKVCKQEDCPYNPL